jgi:hypothetical protein
MYFHTLEERRTFTRRIYLARLIPVRNVVCGGDLTKNTTRLFQYDQQVFLWLTVLLRGWL